MLQDLPLLFIIFLLGFFGELYFWFQILNFWQMWWSEFSHLIFDLFQVLRQSVDFSSLSLHDLRNTLKIFDLRLVYRFQLLVLILHLFHLSFLLPLNSWVLLLLLGHNLFELTRDSLPLNRDHLRQLVRNSLKQLNQLMLIAVQLSSDVRLRLDLLSLNLLNLPHKVH